MVVAGLRGHVGGVQPARSLEVEHEDLCLQQGGGDLLALARLLAFQQRHQDPERAEEAGGQIGDRNTHPHRPASRLARDRHQPAQALRDLVDARALSVRAVLAETGDAGVHQARIDFAQRRVVDAQARLHIRAEVLHHHVGLGGEPAKGCRSLRRLQVERDAALVAMQVLEIGPVARAPQGFADIQVLGQLDLDDIGAPIGQLANGRGTGADTRQVEDSEARKGAGSVRNGHVLTSQGAHAAPARRGLQRGVFALPRSNELARQTISAM
jgi:hypothetical protein